MSIVVVNRNQSIWDLAIQIYGSSDGVKQLIIDNPTICNFETSIQAGTKIQLKQEVINKSVVDFLSKKGLKPATAIEVPYSASWILATGLWNDNAFWNDNALWID